jgi:hypothetical protein
MPTDNEENHDSGIKAIQQLLFLKGFPIYMTCKASSKKSSSFVALFSWVFHL